ncbi:MAG: endonuclease, partial [Bacteroidales bacterium]|nr:endonuclease [Bacteroidales bacterium]
KRGIDVALLYRKDEFQYLAHRSIPVPFKFDTASQVRNILYVKGKTGKNEIFHFFVNHWKSRSGGQQVTEPKRIYTAVTLRKVVDSIFNFEPEAKIIIMGDFNDEPTNMSLHSILQANNKQKNANPRELYNLMYNNHNLNNIGTYSYKGNWNMLDQIIVSQKVISDKKNYHCNFLSGTIYQDKWMMYDNPKVGMLTPNITYGGDMYFGGVSDHLPVFVVLEKK